jgi:hypothetical protein
MTMLSDHDVRARLAEAFHEQADPVAGPVTGPAVNTAGIYARGRQRRRRLIAVRGVSVLAAASLAAGAWTLRPGGAAPAPTAAPGGASAPARAAGVLLDAAIARPQPVAAAQAGMPPYYVITSHDGATAVIRSSATGAVLATAPLPAGIDPKLSLIGAAGNSHTFVLALSPDSGTRFYLLRVSAGGHSARLAPLAVPGLPAGEFANAIAVSPDGRELAVAVQTGAGARGFVEVVTLATGAVRTWAATRPGMPEQLSWASNGRDLGFFWTDDAGTPAASAAGLWVLDTTAAGRNLMSGRRILAASDGPDEVQTALLSPDGATAIASVTYNGTRRVAAGTVVGGIVEVSARTGLPLRTLLAEHAAYSGDPGHAGWYVTGCQLPGIDASGEHLLVSCDSFGRLDRARFTTLPGSAPQVAVAAGW